MLVLYETSLGYCLFKIADSAKAESEDVWEDFETPEKANKLYARVHSVSRDRVLTAVLELRVILCCVIKSQTKVDTPLYLNSNCCRRDYGHPGKQTWQRIEAIPFR